MNQSPRDFDVLVWGATGFTGKIAARYLRDTYASSNLTWAIGGRNEGKLASVRSELSLPESVTAHIADSHDMESLRELVKKARVVLTTVGPYAKYGSELVAACAEAGTHYCDLTGEVHWMREMIDRHQASAAASGARIVHTCGFDSIPSDMGVYFLQKAMRERHGRAEPAHQVPHPGLFRRFQRRHPGQHVDHDGAGAGKSGDHADHGRSLCAESRRSPRPRRAGPQQPFFRRGLQRLGRALRDGTGQHARRPPQQCAAGFRLRPRLPLRRSDPHRRRPAGSARGSRHELRHHRVHGPREHRTRPQPA